MSRQATRPELETRLRWACPQPLIECPTGSGNMCTLFEVARDSGARLASIFTPGPNGRRPVFGGTDKFQNDPLWHDLLLFYEYFHGDNGAGLGASHQTGSTGSSPASSRSARTSAPTTCCPAHSTATSSTELTRRRPHTWIRPASEPIQAMLAALWC